MYVTGLVKGALNHQRDIKPIRKPNLGRLFPPQLSISDRKIPGILYHTWVYDFRKYCANNQVTREEEYQFLKTTPDLIPLFLRSQIAGLDTLDDCYAMMESNFPDSFGEMQVLISRIKGTDLVLKGLDL